MTQNRGAEARVRLGAAAVLAVVFAAGTALGLVVDRAGPPEPTESTETTADVPRETLRAPNGWVIDRMDLSEDQREKVDSIVYHNGAQMSKLQGEYRPRYRAIVDSTDRALRALLAPEQLIRYDSLTAAAQRWRDRNRTRAGER